MNNYNANFNSSNIRKNVNQVLIDSKKITSDQLEKAVKIQAQYGRPITEVLVELGYISEDNLIETLSIELNIPKIDLDYISIDGLAIKTVSKDIAKKYTLIPFKEENGKIYVAMSEPTNLMALDDLKFLTGKSVQVCIAKRSSIIKKIEISYNGENSGHEVRDTPQQFDTKEEDNIELYDSDDMGSSPTVKLANSILVTAVKGKASDIHIEPFENEVIVRYRTDGALSEIQSIPKNLYAALSTRLKIVAGMNIAETRIPQDGRIQMKINNAPYDFRVSSLPTVFGEKIVIRILDRTASIIERDKLGFTIHENEMLDKMLSMPHGILLVTGPTGSGKTTTLYSFLSELNKPDKNIITIEDPVEYMLPRINQVHVNNKAGLTFASGLRSMLRQDPDVIMLGEIRDEETAQIAIRAAITGHFVLSTLHTNDAPSTVTRLLDMGIQSYLVSDALVGVISQRLIRRLCPECKESYIPTEHELELLGKSNTYSFYRQKGCSKCNNTGFKGRIAVHEVMYLDNDLKVMIERNETLEKIKESAIRGGMSTLFGNCKELVERGETTVEEMVKIVYTRD